MRRSARITLAIAGLALTAAWSHPGGDSGHQKYAPLTSITPQNVSGLREAWTFTTGDHAANPALTSGWKFQVTPILFADQLIFCTPRNEVVALDPGTGQALWRFDPEVDNEDYPAQARVCRGVTPWTDTDASSSDPCHQRVFMSTIDRRLVSLDALTGEQCESFGDQGEVKVQLEGPADSDPSAMTFVSPPAIANGVVLIGSAIPDGERTDSPSGKVRAFDARSGEPVWEWDPIPRTEDDPRLAGWLGGSAQVTGAANVWAPISADERRGLFFIPTGSASTDYFGGERPGNNADANSVVALDSETGERVWAFQTVRHDIWDYDVSAPPTLVELETADGRRDVVVQPTKMGFLFVLDRETGEPVFEIEERAVPKSKVDGEWTEPTQAVPVLPKPLVEEEVSSFGVTPWDAGQCEDLVEGFEYEGIFTPPSTKGTIVHPFSGGGMNWGGVAFHPDRQILVVNTSDAAEYARLIPRNSDDIQINDQRFEQEGTPYLLDRGLIRSPLGAPCTDPPWGQLHAIDMTTGEELWRTPLGTFEDVAPFGDLILPEGTPGLGGPLVTQNGVIFIGAAMDDYLRAFDLNTGAELWKGRLPAGGQASPMGYEWEGRDYVVIAAGGHGLMGTTPGDSIVAFALKPGVNGPGAFSWWERPTPRTGFLAAMGVIGLIGLLIFWRRRRKRSA